MSGELTHPLHPDAIGETLDRLARASTDASSQSAEQRAILRELVLKAEQSTPDAIMIYARAQDFSPTEIDTINDLLSDFKLWQTDEESCLLDGEPE